MAEAEPSRAVGTATEPASARRVWWVVSIISILALAAATLATFLLKTDQPPPASTARRNQQVTAVRTAPVVKDTILLTATYRGELDAEVAELSAQATGRLEEVRVNIGDDFEKGDLLAVIDATQTRRQISEALAQAEAAAAAERRAAAELSAAKVELQRGQRLLAEQLVPAQEVDSMKARIDIAKAEADSAEARQAEAQARVALLREQLKETRLGAPFAGAVAERHLDPGALVSPGTRVLRLVRAGPLRVRFRVPERDLGRVSRDMPFGLTTQATAEQRFAGKVSRLAAEVSRSDRSIMVEGVLDAPSDVLRPGMYAEVQLTFGKLEGALTVPSPAVLQRTTLSGGKLEGVFVVTGEVAHWKDVEVLGQSGDVSAIRGLQLGQTVITLGHDQLRDGAAVSVRAEGPHEASGRDRR